MTRRTWTTAVARSVTGLLCLVPPAMAGSVAGKAVGWPPGDDGDLRPGVVWLEGIEPGAGPSSAPRDNPTMAQHAGQFVPSFLAVVVGQTVEMPNLDEVAHNMYSSSPAKSFNLGFYAKGQRRSVTFDRPGLVEVACSIHNFMRAKIMVVPNAFFSVIALDGSFHIANVPPGRYTLNFWGDGIGPLRRVVVVPAEGEVRIDFPVVALAHATRK
jgi:plastocyanin